MKAKTGKKVSVLTDKLGKEIIISENSLVIFNDAEYSVTYLVDTIEVLIGIGNDETASLIMTKEAWNDLKSGKTIHIHEL